MILIRNPDQTKETQGRLDAQGANGQHLSLVTLERPWLDNQNGISCIPVGVYQWAKVPASHIPYPHIELMGVPDREGICIHIGNFFTDSKGCIVVGSGFSDLNKDGLSDVINSTASFHKLIDFLPDSGTIEIKTQTLHA